MVGLNTELTVKQIQVQCSKTSLHQGLSFSFGTQKSYYCKYFRQTYRYRLVTSSCRISGRQDPQLPPARRQAVTPAASCRP